MKLVNKISSNDSYLHQTDEAIDRVELNVSFFPDVTLVNSYSRINLRMRKCLIVGAYKPLEQSKSVLLESLSKSLSIYLDTY